jgi:GxxExxY protein
MTHGYDPAAFPHRDLTEVVIGAFFEVYTELGFGFLESVYHQAMLIALAERRLAVESEVKLPVYFRGRPVGTFDADIFVEREVVLELKAVDELCSAHEAQPLHYLRSSDIEVGLLLNFGPKPRIRRLAFSNERKRSRPSVQLD